jgi:glycosyltransferase involved in cell wall biosynthesis
MLAEQNYPNFEIVLIDDASSDSTLDIFEDFENYTQYPFGKSQK